MKHHTSPIPSIYIIIILVMCTFSSYSQKATQARIDSLLNLLPNAAADTSKVRLLVQLSNNYPYINPNEGLKYGTEAMELAKKLSFTLGIADAHGAIGGNYANKAEYSKALEHEFEALKLYEKLNNMARQASMLRNIGIVMHTSKNQEKALEYDGKALALYQQLGDSAGIAAMYNNMANVYYTLRQSEKVLEYNFKSLEIFKSIHDEAGTARILGNIANHYAETGEFSKAMPYYFDALRKEEALGNKNGVTRNLGNIGQTYYDIANTAPGSVKPDSLIPAGRTANLKKALFYLEATIRSAKEMHQTEYILAFEEILADAYHLSGNNDAALKSYRNYIVIRDSVYDVEKYNAATRRELDYEYGKRQDSITYEKRLTELKLTDEKKSRSRDRTFYIAGIFLVAVFSGFMYNRWRITRRQKQVIEVEKKRSDELLLNILPAETAEELKQTGSAQARDFDEVTVLFTDFKNFTSLSEQLSAQELVNEINYCYSEFDHIITRHGIEKIKTIGDSYMCAGGLPVENRTNAVDTVSAALEIREFMVREQKTRQAEGKPFFEIRIGLHTGPVVAGIVGIKKFAYDIWGDTVNIASRMESSGEPGKVNISGTTYNLVQNKFKCTFRGKLEAKNKGTIEMYFVDEISSNQKQVTGDQ